MRILFLLFVLLLCQFAYADMITVQQGVGEAELLSDIFIRSLYYFEAGKQQAAEEKTQVACTYVAHFQTEFWNFKNNNNIFYSNEFKYGGRLDLTTWYWNPPIERTDFYQIPETKSLYLMIAITLILFFLKTGKLQKQIEC
jgi:hypothetical protein